MKDRQEEIARWARQMGVSESDLERFLSDRSLASDGTPLDALETGFFFLDDGDEKDPNLTQLGMTEALDIEERVEKSAPEDLTSKSAAFPSSAQSEKLGRYDDLGVLGIGGMGEVRQVRDGNLRRTMAMKIIHRRMLANSKLVARFIEEAQVQAQLQHPNIVPIYEISQLPDGRHYFTMKQIRGTEFSKKIQAVHAASQGETWTPTRSGTSFRDLVRIHQQVCETIAYAHAQGVIHRDLKPENIMIGGFGEVQVVDWGLAKVVDQAAHESEDSTDDAVETDRSNSDALQTHVGSVSGTPCYMAPEQAFGRTEEVGRATDVYTLGVILYEILSGAPPYQGHSPEDVLEKVKHSRPPALRHATRHTSLAESSAASEFVESLPLAVSAKIPERLAQLCEAAMKQEVVNRVATARSLADDLKAWLEGAEKRDKALAEFDVASQLAEQAREQERKSAAEWREANALMEHDGAASDEGWTLWREARASKAESRKFWRRYVRGLRAALVHAPNLEEAHRALAEQRVQELITASALGDRAVRETRTQQLNAHLQMLPASTRAELESQRDTGLADGIWAQRIRRGNMVGRNSQREAVVYQVEAGARMITLLGTAGVGKTRLALELTEDLEKGFSRTVFCDLTEATDFISIAHRMSRSLDVRLRETNPVEHLAEVLATDRTLLILDNLEQITPIIGPLITQWIDQSETLHILATSRVRLGIQVETVVPVQPLSLLEGIDLFVRRGQAADPRFEVGPDQRDQICALVTTLDNLPLALELAAARLNVLSLDELSTRLSERFSLLRSRGRNAQALDTALDWSWGMLQPWAKAALSQASLFRGGFTLASAEGVINVGTYKKTTAMFDILGELVENSLLRKDQVEGGGIRYSLLESIRAYAYDKLGDPGEMGPELRGPEALQQAQERHAAYFSQLGSTKALEALDGFDGGNRWAALFGELDNLVEATRHGRVETASLCCLAALKVLAMKGPVSLGVELSTQVLEMPDLGRREQMLLEIERGKCLRISGRMDEARAMVTGTVSQAPEDQATGPLQSEAQPAPVPMIEPADTSKPSNASTEPGQEPALIEAERLMELGWIEHEQSHYDKALVCLQEALAHFKNLGNRAGEGRALGNLANLYEAQGQYDQAIAHYTQALAILREVGDKRSEGINLGNLGTVYLDQGKFDQAIAHYTKSIAIHREVGNKRVEGNHLGNLGLAYQAQGKLDQAIATYTQSISIAREIGDKRNEGTHLGNLGDVLFKLQRLDEAEAVFRDAIPICELAMPIGAGVFRGSLALLLAQRGKTHEAFTMLGTGEPQVVTHPEEHAKFLCKKGQVCQLAGDTAAAQDALRQAQKTAATLKVSEDSEVGKTIAELRTILEGPGPIEATDAESSAEERELALIEAQRLMELGQLEGDQSNYDKALLCFQEAIEHFKSHGDRAGEGKALNRIGTVYHELGKLDEAIIRLTAAIAIAEETGDKNSEALNLGNLANVFMEQGKYNQAVTQLSRSIGISRDLGNKRQEGINLGNLANAYHNQAQNDKAIEHYTQAIRIAREIGDKHTESINVGNLGSVYLSQAQNDKAMEHLNQAIHIARKIGNKRSESFHLGNIARVYKSQTQYNKAMEHLNQAIRIARETGDEKFEAIYLGNQGETLFKLQRFEEAEAVFRQSISISDPNLPAAAGAFRGSLAVLLAQQGNVDEARVLIAAGEPQVKPMPEQYAIFLCNRARVSHLAGDLVDAKAALEEAQKLGVKFGFKPESESGKAITELVAILVGPPEERELALIEAKRLMELGRLEFDQSHYDKAVLCFEDAIAHFKSHGDRAGEGKALGHLGNAYQATGRLERAIEHFDRAIAISRELGNKSMEGVQLGNLGLVYKIQGQHDRAITLFTQTLGIARDIGDKLGEGVDLGNLASVYVIQGQYARAIDLFTKALMISREIGDRRLEAVWLGNLGDALLHQNRLDEADANLRKAIPISDQTFPVAAGSFRGTLALLLAKKGQHNEAASLLKTGEPQVRHAPEEHAKFLCKKSQVCHLAGHLEEAQAALKQAQEIAATLKVTDHSELGRAIAQLMGFLKTQSGSDEL